MILSDMADTQNIFFTTFNGFYQKFKYVSKRTGLRPIKFHSLSIAYRNYIVKNHFE